MTGNFLKEKLQSIDIQMIDIAKKLEISPQSLQSRLKSNDISLSFLCEISSAVNKSPYHFVEGTKYEKFFISTNGDKLNEPNTIYKNESDTNLNELVRFQREKIKELEAKLDELIQGKSRTGS